MTDLIFSSSEVFGTNLEKGDYQREPKRLW